jgi:hypothetical protein
MWSGELIGYVRNAPTVVNRAFTAKYKLGGFRPQRLSRVGTGSC